MSTSLRFTLKDAVVTSQPSAPNGDNNAMKRGSQRKQATKLKMFDDPKTEGMYDARRTTYIPSFAMLDKEGSMYPDQVTDRLCQWDHYPITGRPVGLPIERYLIKKKPQYVCVRWFCSLECMRSFYKKYCKDDATFAKTLKHIDEMHKLTLQHLKQPFTTLEDAPDWNILKLVGSGTVDIDEFRSPWAHKYVKVLAFVQTRGVEAYIKHQ